MEGTHYGNKYIQGENTGKRSCSGYSGGKQLAVLVFDKYFIRNSSRAYYKVGVITYLDEDGKILWQYQLPFEAFDQKSKVSDLVVEEKIYVSYQYSLENMTKGSPTYEQYTVEKRIEYSG